jgi:predicted nuclease of restriction endonuclease-like (RecB) superfamily
VFPFPTIPLFPIMLRNAQECSMSQNMVPQDMVPPEEGYAQLLDELKSRIQAAQARAALAVNRELVLLYWQIGRTILERQALFGWGSQIVPRPARDLRQAFPGAQGWSARNLHYMRAFAEAYPHEAIVQALPAQIPWYHNQVLLDRVKDPVAREWYMQQTAQQGWSGRDLIGQIERGTYERQGQAPTNFLQQLPEAQSELAHQLLKDPYNFDFLLLSERAQERDLEQALLTHMQEFLLELGRGFAFMGMSEAGVVANRGGRAELLPRFVVLSCNPALLCRD